jgi:hypothetical protein
VSSNGTAGRMSENWTGGITNAITSFIRGLYIHTVLMH